MGIEGTTTLEAPSFELIVATAVVLTGLLILFHKHPTRHGSGKENRGKPSRKKGVNHLPPEKRPEAFKPQKKHGKGEQQTA